VKNSNNSAWTVGNLDAKATVVWKFYSGNVKLPLTAEGELVEHLPVVSHPKFTASPPSVEILISTGPALRKAGQTTVTLNGQEIERGTYKAVPGTYELVVPGFKLIAPTTQQFYTTGQSLEFVALEVIQLTPQQEAVMEKSFSDLAKECAEPNDVLALGCFGFSDIYRYRTTESGYDSEDYFGLKSSNFEIMDSVCEGSVSDRIIAADVTYQTANCAATVKFDVEYFDSKVENRPVFKTERYDGCPEIRWAFCERFRQVRIGTDQFEVRGKSLGTAKLESRIPYELSLFGILNDKDEFSSSDSWVAPAPNANPKPNKPTPITLLGRYETKADMIAANPNPELGDGYIVGSALFLWVWNGNSWVEIGRR
jgi:hypothetical protein